MATLLQKKPTTNVGETERWISLVAGAGLLAYGLTRRDRAGLGLAAVGTSLAWRGSSGHCGIYQAFGVNTSERGYGKGTGSKGGVPYELGIRIDQEVRIAKPAAELYRFWRNFENLPRFMKNLNSVEVKSDKLSHWAVRGLIGLQAEWDAEIINEIENRLIGWRSLPGSNVDIGGSVHFDEIGNGETIVRISLQYNPPAGSVGARIYKAIGEDPEAMVHDDLQRFKELMETGAVTTASTKKQALPSDERWKNKKSIWDKRDKIESSSEESFPASDAPSWTPEAL